MCLTYTFGGMKMHTLIDLYPFAKQTNDNIDKQNKFLQKISLTGKINAQESSQNLFAYTDETIIKFEKLKQALITALIEESHKKITQELTLKAQCAIDILKRNLFERTADVGFLSSDDAIIHFLKNPEQNKDDIRSRLKAYVAKYSVYEDVILFDTQGTVHANINPNNRLTHSNSPLIKETLKADSYLEYYGTSDISKTDALLYLQKIISKGETIGVLCLHFKFEDEMKRIFDTLLEEEDLLFMQEQSTVIASSNPTQIRPQTHVTLSKQKDLLLYAQKRIAIQTKTTGYQDYFGLDWTMSAINPLNETSDTKALHKQVLTAKLKSIIDEAHEIVDDLGDVIINGELIASKYRQYTLSPILDNLRNISSSLLRDIDNAAENLATTNTNALLKDAQIATQFSIDIMDRNLYERANDSRWWALTPLFIQELQKESPDTQALHDVLSHINSLYTVYTDIMIYDEQGSIIATSNNQNFVGKKLSCETSINTLRNKNPQNYYVSAFESSPYYDDKATYIYHASILHHDKSLGGIAVVFDGAVEFEAILRESALQNKKGFSLFCHHDRTVIASTNPHIKVLETLPLTDEMPAFTDEIQQRFITFEQKSYLLSIVPSSGYREYKTQDNYKNEVYALSFIEI